MSRPVAFGILLVVNIVVVGAVDTIWRHDVDPADVDYKDAKKVVLKSVKINEIPKHYFRDMKLDLSSLRISNSRLTRIDEEAFDGLDHLNLLELSDDEITHLEPKTFERLRGLEFLYLKSNKLRRISLSLKNVQEIVLSRNEIDYLQEDFILGDSVTFLDLRFNRLERLEHSVKSLGKLSTINIAYNEISYIDPGVFAGSDSLVRVIAGGNRLNSTVGLRIKSLMSLDVSDNAIRSLDNSSFAGMTYLNDLNLEGNRIEELDDVFGDLIKLQFLDLSNNRIRCMSPHLFANNQDLSKLRLAKNKLTELRPFASNLRRLVLLDLSHNDIRHIDPGFFRSVDKLETLDLSFNRLSTLGHVLAPLSALVKLDVSNNRIDFDANTTLANAELRSLNLSSNGLDVGASAFANNPGLLRLDLSDNNITDFCDADFPLERISFIDLSRNRIRHLNCFKERNLIPFPEIEIRDNPLACDSNLDDVIHHFVLMQSLPYGAQAMDAEDVLSANETLRRNLAAWNAIKRRLCPNGLDLHIEVEDGLESDDEESDSDSNADYGGGGFDSTESSSRSEDRSEPAPAEEEILKVEVKVESEIRISEDEVPEAVAQSERESWKLLNKAAGLENDDDEDGGNQDGVSLLTLSLILIGVFVFVVVANVSVLMYVRSRGWKKDFRKLQKYKAFVNERKSADAPPGYAPSSVYKDTTIPIDYVADGVSPQEDNYKINCSRLFVNFGFRAGDDDTESVKKMIVDNGHKGEM